MSKPDIKTLGALKKSNYKSISIKEEIRKNLISKLEAKETPFPGIIGYEDTVIPDVERAILSRHNILFLGLRGQAKTRLARQITSLLDEYIPVVQGSDINDDPLKPVSRYAIDLIEKMGDETPVEWIHRNDRYAEKLATPDVSVSDLIGDIDPIIAANLKLSFADERIIHYGIIPRSNRGIFVINELPDLQARIQVSLFNILEEGDLQIRGFKLRLPLDILFIFTANPEDYTNRGSIVTPLKDRIESQILTHYPTTIENSLLITDQEAHIHENQEKRVSVSDLIRRLIEQVSFEARNSEFVDKKSGVSARLTISAYENAVSAAERRAIINNEAKTQVWVSDLTGIFPSVTGKIELVYEGEQEGPFQVAYNLLEKSIRSQFVKYFPDPDMLKRRRSKETVTENPYKTIISWFDSGNHLDILFGLKDEAKILMLNKVNGLADLVKKQFPNANKKESALLMEFVLHGLAAFSLISKKVSDGKVEFKDLVGSIINLSTQSFDESELE
ncbi:MAG: AAA family ATPase [Chitinophagaceae bacterium]|nr:AAA family ATPase [Chitinophagaceae bacterium]